MHDFLIRFAHSWLDFRLPELDSIISNINAHVDYDHETLSRVKAGKSPFLLINTPSVEIFKDLVGRAILIKDGYLVLAKSFSLDGLIEAMKEYLDEPNARYPFHLYRNLSFKYTTVGFLKKPTQGRTSSYNKSF